MAPRIVSGVGPQEDRDEYSDSPTDTNLSAYGKARSTVHGAPLSADGAAKTHAYWRACNYLASA